MTLDLSNILQQAGQELDGAADLRALDQVRVSYLGKKGLITEQLKSLGYIDGE